MHFQPLLACRLVVLFFLSLWLSIAVINNVTDSNSNINLVTNTLTMSLLHGPGENMGQGLLWRALPQNWITPIYFSIVLVQFSIACLLWNAWFLYVRAYHRKSQELVSRALARVIVALTCFLAFWLAFICGGLWFGYWLKQGAVQSVHMTLILISLATILLFEKEIRLDCKI